jgi:alanine racemase
VNCSSALTTPLQFATLSSPPLSSGTTSQIAFAPSTVPNSPRRRVQFSVDALRENLRRLTEGGPESLVVDLRCDAYGFGASWVRATAESVGCDKFLTDDNVLDPIPPTTSELFGLSAGLPVATLIGEIVAMKSINSGESVSYGYTWTAERPTLLALVSLGFADGVPRSGSNVTTARVNEVSAPVVGRIAMDQLVLDVTEIPAELGDDVQFWSNHDEIAAWAKSANRDALSLVAGLSWRVERDWSGT